MATKTGLPETREELVQMLINRKQPRAADLDDDCTYSHSCNGGCAIGVALKKTDAEFLESNIVSEFDELILHVLQVIHDTELHWWDHEKATIGYNGLVWSNKGVLRIKKLIKTYKLNIKL